MWRKAAWALGVAAAMSAGGAFAGTPATPADSGSSGGSSLDSRVTAMEQELEDLKRGQAENTAKSAPAPGTFRAYWNKGIVLETSDKAFVMKVDGRVDWDFGVIRQDSKNKAAFGNIMDGSEFRRLRLEFSGDLYENTYFKAQVDFGGGKVALKDALIGFKGVPLLGKVQAGHFTEPFGLEEITSDKYDTFIEQSLATDTFVPSRNAGLAFFNSAANDRVTYAAGVFRDTGDDGTTVADSGYAFTGRVTALPWYEEDGRKLVHVGVAWRHNQPPTGAATYEVRPEWHASSKKFVSTGSISHVEATDTLGLEAAFVYGPFSAQGEFFQSTVSRESGFSDASFNGCYVEGSYWLTGENRKYEKKTGEFGRVSPTHNFGKDGWGAWQLAARYSRVDLNDSGAGISGGVENNVSLGVNWHLNPNMRIMADYVRATTADPDKGGANMFIVRFHADF